jgi:hypothetical protein
MREVLVNAPLGSLQEIETVPPAPTLLGRGAFRQEVARLTRRPPELPGDVPLDLLGFDNLERYLLIALLATCGVPVTELTASAIFTLDDAYEQYALAMVTGP